MLKLYFLRKMITSHNTKIIMFEVNGSQYIENCKTQVSFYWRREKLYKYCIIRF